MATAATQPAPGTKIFGLSPALVFAVTGAGVGALVSMKAPMGSDRQIMSIVGGAVIGTVAGAGYSWLKTPKQDALPAAS